MRARIVSATRGTVICERAEVADGFFKRLRGLMGRSGLEQGAGVLFKHEPSIHSAFMRFDFDAVFLDRELRVLRCVARVPPWRAHGARGTRNVLELAAGEIERLGIQVGELLEVTEL